MKDKQGLSNMTRSARYFERYSTEGPGRLNEIIAMQRSLIQRHIHLIASACFPFPSVLKAMAEPSFILPVEGMPGRRYLPGAEIMDIVEAEGERLVLELFQGTEGFCATLQPHSGTQANQIAYNAVLEPEDQVLCLKANDGGHISHTVLLSRRNQTINYGLTQEGQIDYDNLERLAIKHRPKLIIVGGSALPRQIDFSRCAAVASSVGAYLHADISHTATFIAAGLHSNVLPHSDFVTFNTAKNLRGPNSGILIYRSGFKERVSKSIFPTTQGGANESNMLGQFAALTEWSARSLIEYAHSIVHVSSQLGEVFDREGIELVTDGSDCHLQLLRLPSEAGSGAVIEKRLQESGILVNRNLVPGDRRSPSKTSGIRIGSTNLAILGYSDHDIRTVGELICQAVQNKPIDRAVVESLLEKYPASLLQ